jgi:SOS-response transcriptional repressor LexA
MSHLYEVTGFQSPCAEFAEKPLSLDERYLTNKPSLFMIESAGDSKSLGIVKGDKLLIDRSLSPKEGQLCVCVIQNQFQILKFSSKLLQGQDPETGDFVWGVITTLIREFNRRIED